MVRLSNYVLDILSRRIQWDTISKALLKSKKLVWTPLRGGWAPDLDVDPELIACPLTTGFASVGLEESWACRLALARYWLSEKKVMEVFLILIFQIKLNYLLWDFCCLKHLLQRKLLLLLICLSWCDLQALHSLSSQVGHYLLLYNGGSFQALGWLCSGPLSASASK